MKKQITILFSSLLVTAMMWGLPASAATRYVAPSGSSAWSGETVYNTVADAISAASASDEIWIATGTYDVTAAITIGKNLKLYGGFVGTETAIEDRVKAANGAAWEFQNPTVLLKSYDVNAGSTTGFITASTYAITLDGITLDGNKANYYGGVGVYSSNGTVTISNCIIRNFQNRNTAGTTWNDGGGLNIRGTNDDQVYNCLIENNEAIQAAGAYLERVTMHHCIIRNNKGMKSDDGNLAGGGGGIFLASAGATAYSCLIEGNEATYGGGVFIRSNSMTGTRALYNCIIVNNRAYSGTGVGFRGNYSNSNIYSTQDIVYNCIIANNQAVDTGFGTFYARNGNGAGVKFPYDETITSSIYTSAQSGKFYNCILYNNTGVDGNVCNVEVASTTISPAFKNNILESASITNLTQTNCVVETDPAKLFANVAAGDYSLPATFAGLDLGDATGLTFADNKDYAGEARVQGTAIEIGAYEVENLQVAVTYTIGEGISEASVSAGTIAVNAGTYSLTFKKAAGYSRVIVLVNGVYTEPQLAGDTYTLNYTVPAGTPVTIAISAYLFAENVIPVSEDTYVSNKATTTNFSTATTIGVAGDIENNYTNYKGYLYFDLSAIKSSLLANYDQVSLKVVYAPGNNSKSFTEVLSVRTVKNEVKAEGLSTLTWSNSAEVASTYSGTEIAQGTVEVLGAGNVANQTETIDLTTDVFAALNDDGKVWYQLALITASGGSKNDGHLASFYSLENGNAAYVPQLVFSSSDPTAISAVTVDDNAPVRYFTLQGVEVSAPVKGNLYIVRQGAKAKKLWAK
jgi:hypothetical protein